ncbi:MAG: transporter substrate-binding domain-containing protein [Rhodospirillaceae bacterium]|nr:transporter substrate-binding domain-containing protein [Rhodospirillaceae bacterium]
MTNKFSAIFVLLLSVMFHFDGALAAEKIYLSSGIRDPFTTINKDGFIDQIVREAFSRIGVDAEVIVYQNSAKSLSNANSGIDDGAALRIKGIDKKFTNLVIVPEKLMDNDFIAYSLGMNKMVSDWKSLEKYKITHIEGWQIFKNNTKNHPNVTLVKTPQEMFDSLSQLEIDVILYERWQGLWRAKEMGLKVKSHEPPLASVEMFMYLNNKHKDKAIPVATALAQMKKDGTYERIYNQTLAILK